MVTSPLTFSPNKSPPIICDHRTGWSVRFWIKRYLWQPFIFCGGGGGIKLLEYPKLAVFNGYVWWAGSNRFLKSTFCLAFIFHIAKCTTQIGYGNKFSDLESSKAIIMSNFASKLVVFFCATRCLLHEITKRWLNAINLTASSMCHMLSEQCLCIVSLSFALTGAGVCTSALKKLILFRCVSLKWQNLH